MVEDRVEEMGAGGGFVSECDAVKALEALVAFFADFERQREFRRKIIQHIRGEVRPLPVQTEDR